MTKNITFDNKIKEDFINIFTEYLLNIPKGFDKNIDKLREQRSKDQYKVLCSYIAQTTVNEFEDSSTEILRDLLETAKNDLEG